MNSPLARIAGFREAPANPYMGTWLSLGSVVAAEVCARFCFDWVLLDLEHGGANEGLVLPILQAMGPSANVIVRVPSNEPKLIGRVLDWGASGIMLPHVGTAGEAERALEAMRFAPHGKRGYSSSARVFGYGVEAGGAAEAGESPLFLAQIESAEGVENVGEIARVRGVDCLFVGPSDLMRALDAGSPEGGKSYQVALERVVDACRGAGIGAGILLRSTEEIEPKFREGFNCLAIASDLSILKKGFAEIQHAITALKESR